MALTQEQWNLVEEFRAWMESHVGGSSPWGQFERHDREDGSTLATRWAAGEHAWFEVAVRPFLPQVRVGILTDDRWKSEELEQRIEDSGDSMSEFVELGFETAGLEWPDPPVEHYREQAKYFYFATPLDLTDLKDVAEEGVRRKVLQMLEGYYHAFSGGR
ncbi:MAG TPA: hypothetical protein PL151_06580 [Phycisphaerae bacterium]|nr:hypothetical protein [Phycisphaerae bacterium]HOJ73773.1 hypothetical protein [Phycisphaerae bacterium]HOM50420.1 hypothetical protein [Phycisphaerae bacterium]HON65466.1 hypothetical protein [Phycisphaerae bacterium]HOQ84168.1 hypothetical protein [Phycisphaerae bacterium]